MLPSKSDRALRICSSSSGENSFRPSWFFRSAKIAALTWDSFFCEPDVPSVALYLAAPRVGVITRKVITIDNITAIRRLYLFALGKPEKLRDKLPGFLITF